MGPASGTASVSAPLVLFVPEICARSTWSMVQVIANGDGVLQPLGPKVTLNRTGPTGVVTGGGPNAVTVTVLPALTVAAVSAIARVLHGTPASMVAISVRPASVFENG